MSECFDVGLYLYMMNVSNFFNFIGEKRPKYRMSSNNEELLNILKKGFENGVVTGGNDEREEFIPIPVDNKGYYDEKGKQGLFIQTVGRASMVRTMDLYDFDYQTIYSNYKDNELDGLKTIMDRFDSDRVQLTITYSNGLKNGPATRYKNGKVDEITYYDEDYMTRTEIYYKNGQLQQVYHYKQELFGRAVPDTNVERLFFDPEGNPLDQKTFFDNKFNMY